MYEHGYDDLAEDDDSVLYADGDPERERDLALLERHVKSVCEELAGVADETGSRFGREDLLVAAFVGLGWSEAAANEAARDDEEGSEAIMLDALRDREAAIRCVDAALDDILAELQFSAPRL